MIKKWLTVVVGAVLVTAFALLPGRADSGQAAADPGGTECAPYVNCWTF